MTLNIKRFDEYDVFISLCIALKKGIPVSTISKRQASSSIVTCFRYESSIVGSINKEKEKKSKRLIIAASIVWYITKTLLYTNNIRLKHLLGNRRYTIFGNEIILYLKTNSISIDKSGLRSEKRRE